MCKKNCPSRGLMDFQDSVGEFDKRGGDSLSYYSSISGGKILKFA